MHDTKTQPTDDSWPSVAVLILNWNGRSLLETALPPLLAQAYANFTVILIDNASSDDSVQFVSTQHPSVTIIKHDENLGFSRGYNPVLRQTDADILLLLNNDVIVQPGWLRALIAPFREDPQIGITGSKLLFPDGTIQHMGAELSTPLGFSHHHHYREADHPMEQTEPDYVTGASLAIRKDVAAQVNYFDEAFAPFYYEEVDLCWRVRAAGYRIIVTPDSVAIHDESASIKQRSGFKNVTFHKNRLTFLLKHHSADAFLRQIMPAEADYVCQPATADTLQALQQAYLQTAVSTHTLLSQRGEIDYIEPIQTSLLALRQLALDQPSSAYEPISHQWPHSALAPRQMLVEPEFSSAVPLFGPLIVAVRRLWNSISTKWYVRSIMQQQMGFNQMVSRLLAEQAAQDRANAAEISLLFAEIEKLKQQAQPTPESPAHDAD